MQGAARSCPLRAPTAPRGAILPRGTAGCSEPSQGTGPPAPPSHPAMAGCAGSAGRPGAHRAGSGRLLRLWVRLCFPHGHLGRQMSVSSTLIFPFYFFTQKHQRTAQVAHKRPHRSARDGSFTRAGSPRATVAPSPAGHARGHPRTPLFWRSPHPARQPAPRHHQNTHFPGAKKKPTPFWSANQG